MMPETRTSHTRTVDLSASDVLASLSGIQMSQGPYAGQVSVFVTISDGSENAVVRFLRAKYGVA